MRVTIYGGSFSPIHKGHIALASQIIKEDMADEVWLMVSPHNPLKSTNDLWPVDIRLKLCEKAVEGLEKIKVSDLETRLEKPSYTYKTLRELSRLHPQVQFSILIGSDNWACFDRWAHHEEILTHHSLIIYPRQGFPINPHLLPPQTSLLNAPLLPYSSSEIRQRLKAGRPINHMLPPNVAEMIATTEYAGKRQTN